MPSPPRGSCFGDGGHVALRSAPSRTVGLGRQAVLGPRAGRPLVLSFKGRGLVGGRTAHVRASLPPTSCQPRSALLPPSRARRAARLPSSGASLLHTAPPGSIALDPTGAPAFCQAGARPSHPTARRPADRAPGPPWRREARRHDR